MNNTIFNIAKTNGVGKLVIGDQVVDVKIVDIEHRHGLKYEADETKIQAIVVDPTSKFDPQDISTWYPKTMITKATATISYAEYAAREVAKMEAANRKSGPYPWGHKIPEIKEVIFNNPATIVIWKDGEKTVVKAQNGEPYDPEKGLAMAITKRALGNKGSYCNVLHQYILKGQEHYTPEQFNSEVCHVDKLDEFSSKYFDECHRNTEALAVLKTLVGYKKVTKEVMLKMINEAIKYLTPDNEKDEK